VCLERTREDVRDFAELRLEWKSFLLRPHPEPKPLDRFRRYTESWMRPAGQADAGEFRIWATDESPPSHSIPSAVAVKAAARQGAFDAYHLAIMRAYFSRNLDVSARPNILRVAAECGLDTDRFERDLDDGTLAETVIAEHNQAVELGITGVPCVVLANGFAMPGAQERAMYVRIVQRLVRDGENA
jgi:predicted DsbA family dithiol-disulfide isomerase